MKYKVAKTMCVAVALTLSPATGVMATELKDGGEETALESSSFVLREEQEPTEKEPTQKEPTQKVPTVKGPTVKEPTENEAVEKEATEKEPTEKEPTQKEPTVKEPTEKELVVPAVEAPIEVLVEATVEAPVEVPLEVTLTIHHVLHLDVGEINTTEEIGGLGTQDSFNEADYVMDLKDEEILFIGETKEVKLIQGKNEITLDYGFKEKEQSNKLFSEER